jgi:hypothetical protein
MIIENLNDSCIPGGKITVYYHAGVVCSVTNGSLSEALRQEIADRYSLLIKRTLGREQMPRVSAWIVAEKLKTPEQIGSWAEDYRIHAQPFPQGAVKTTVDLGGIRVIHLSHLGADFPEELLHNDKNEEHREERRYYRFVDYVVCEDCNADALLRVLDRWHPRAVIPVHWEQEQELVDRVSLRWPVIRLERGDTFNPVPMEVSCKLLAEVVTIDLTAKRNKVLKNPNREAWWKVNNWELGNFDTVEHAVEALRHTVYDPKRLIGFMVADVSEFREDFFDDPEVCVNPKGLLEEPYYSGPYQELTFAPDMTPVSHYKRKNNYTDPEYAKVETVATHSFHAGEKVWAWVDSDMEALIPVEVIGEPTREMKDEYLFEKWGQTAFYPYLYGQAKEWEKSFVAVRPLVFIEHFYKGPGGHRVLQEVEIIPASFLFPYREFDVKNKKSTPK